MPEVCEDLFHISETEFSVFPIECSPLGAVGFSCADSSKVLTFKISLFSETCPLAETASTSYLYSVDATKLESLNWFPFTVATLLPLRYTLYFSAVVWESQLNETVFFVTFVVFTFVGFVGNVGIPVFVTLTSITL